ncbi:MAG: replicative DNA helicase [Bacteroidales bacterium]|jgi:replicative DNA helicase|nr:replicative DNA helicase [Bacteroidales bacterium]
MAEVKEKKGTFVKTKEIFVDAQGRVAPQSVDFEEAVLGAMMLEAEAASLVLEHLHEDMFYKPEHKVIFQAISEVFATGGKIDLLTVTEKLRKNKKLDAAGGSYNLALLTNKVISSAHIEYHARIINEKHILRSLIEISSQAIREAYDNSTDALDLLEKTEQNLFEISEKNFTRSGETMPQLMQNFMKELEELQKSEEALRGVPSGFTDLDRITQGWQPSNLIILAARPAMGKTGLVLSMARNMTIDYKRPVAFFSLEMSAADLMMRMVSSETSIPIEHLKTGKLSQQEMLTLTDKMSNLTDAPLIIDDTAGLTIFDLKAKCRRLKQQHNIQCVIIDYLQLMSLGTKEAKGNREQEISTISRSLKILAKDLHIPIIALSQLSRDVEKRSTTSKRPQLSDLRESGAIEQDADLVLFIYRPEVYGLSFDDKESSAGLAEIIIAKHRNGRTGDVRMQFIAQQAKFCDIDKFSNYSASMATGATYSQLMNSEDGNVVTLQSAMNDDIVGDTNRFAHEQQVPF